MGVGGARLHHRLLIEPVWNRNPRRSIVSRWVLRLLIEPVWNRNAFDVDTEFRVEFSFNRTSMESKLNRHAQWSCQPAWHF